MLEYITQLAQHGGVTFWLVVGAFLVPGLALVILERTLGHETELKGPLWAAAFTPLFIALAGSQWRAAFSELPHFQAFSAEGAQRVVGLGVALTLVLVVLAGPAAAAARRRRKPEGGAPA